MIGPVELPPHITPAQVAKACGLRTETARRRLQRAGILEKLGGACVVPESRLRDRLPDYYDRVYAMFARQAEKRRATQGDAETRR